MLIFYIPRISVSRCIVFVTASSNLLQINPT